MINNNNSSQLNLNSLGGNNNGSSSSNSSSAYLSAATNMDTSPSRTVERRFKRQMSNKNDDIGYEDEEEVEDNDGDSSPNLEDKSKENESSDCEKCFVTVGKRTNFHLNRSEPGAKIDIRVIKESTNEEEESANSQESTKTKAINKMKTKRSSKIKEKDDESLENFKRVFTEKSQNNLILNWDYVQSSDYL